MNTYLLLNSVQLVNVRENKVQKRNVLIKNNIIQTISSEPINVERDLEDKYQEINCHWNFLSPGLIDAHWHTTLCGVNEQQAMMLELPFIHLVAGAEAEKQLLRGFTTVRDAGGPSYGLKRAIDERVVKGPRIYPSGPMISQTAGHGDFRNIYDTCHSGCGCDSAYAQKIGASWIVDGVDAVMTATRENLKQGSSQIKLMVGGGAASQYDPLDVAEFFEEEIHAAVRAADDWGTYVMVHVYNPKGIQRAINAGVRSIEHGHLIDEESMELLANRGVWLSMQPFAVEDNTYPSPTSQAKHLQICQGTDRTYQLAKKYKAKLAWGTDLLFNPSSTKNENKGILKLKQWFSNYEILKMVTIDNAELLALSGNRNPYPNKLGTIEEGAYADVILMNDNPLNNIDVLGDPETNFSLIVKDGVIYKNSH